VLLAGVVTGCSDTTKETAATPSASASVKTAATIKINVAPGTAKGFVGARVDVTDLTCKQSGAVWKVAGKVTNPSKGTANYRIYTSFLTAQNDTRGLLETDVNGVTAGASKSWAGELALKDKGLSCVLRVERTPVK
jgi:hypothetical protein